MRPPSRPRGLHQLRPLLDRIDRIHDKAALTRLLGSGLQADVDPLNWGVYGSSHLLGLSVEEGNHGEKNYVAFLLQGGLGLPDREYYTSTEPRMQTVRTQYRLYIEGALARAGLDHAQPRADGVMALENRDCAESRFARGVGRRSQRTTTSGPVPTSCVKRRAWTGPRSSPPLVCRSKRPSSSGNPAP